MKKPETLLKDKMLKEARARGAVIEKLHGSRAQRRGIGDFLICHRGVWINVEVKMPGEKLRSDQKRWIEEINAADGIVPVIENIAALHSVLDGLEREARWMNRLESDWQ